MSIPHPIPYQGSKRALASAILTYFPHGTHRLIEPFAGSAAVSLAAAYYRKVERFVLNDTNVALMELWQLIINEPEFIAAKYRKLWEAQQGQERKFYDLIRKQFNRTRLPDHFLYLLARCVKASVRYNSYGEFNQSPDNRRRGANPETMRANIIKASQLLRGKTRLSCGDYTDVLNSATQSDVVYMDPPYQGVCGNRDTRYINSVTFDSFTRTLDALNNGGVSYIVSYDGRSGSRIYGRPLPKCLNLVHIELDAGRSSQFTLLGRNHRTYESIYLSPALVHRIEHAPPATASSARSQEQLVLTEFL